MSVSAPDFTKAPPRSGRDMLGGYAWLARLADKARAEAAGTGGDYVAYCGMSQGFLRAAGVSQAAFAELIAGGADDAALAAYFDQHVTPERRKAANHYILETMASHLDEQDAEEGRR
jgi:hypothetical protein